VFCVVSFSEVFTAFRSSIMCVELQNGVKNWCSISHCALSISQFQKHSHLRVTVMGRHFKGVLCMSLSLHRLLLYLSLFGFTMEPRAHRAKFQPPRGFMDDAEGRKTPRRIIVPLPIPANPQTLGPMIVLQGRGPNSETSWKFSQPMSEEEMSAYEKSRDGPLPRFELKYTWEYMLLLQAGPEEVRREVEVLISDLIVRLKQLLFNSLFCAYYVGFIPMQFADSRLYYDKWWCMEHAFLVWANSFVILSTHLLPPSYCQLLFQCSMNLGCWTRCTHSDTHNVYVTCRDHHFLNVMVYTYGLNNYRNVTKDGERMQLISVLVSSKIFLFHNNETSTVDSMMLRPTKVFNILL
jgi:hypothetical protein